MYFVESRERKYTNCPFPTVYALLKTGELILKTREWELGRLPVEFDRIVQPIEPTLMRIAWNIMGNLHDAEDALQDAMSIVVQRWPRVLAHPAPASLVIKICTECTLDLLRKRIRQHAKSSLFARDGTRRKIPAPEDACVDSELRQAVMGAIATLPRQQSLAFTLRILEEYDYDRIAGLLHCSPATARTHVARARQRLSVLLTQFDPNGEKRR